MQSFKKQEGQVQCRRCWDQSEAVYYTNSVMRLCENCYEFLLDLQETGETLSSHDIMPEGY